MQGVTALFQAAATGNLPIVQALVTAGAVVDACAGPDVEPAMDSMRTESAVAVAFTPLQAAAACGHVAVIQYLCAKVCDTV